MKSILTPSLEKNHRRSAIVILFLLVFSAMTLTFAPVIMPEGYSWIVHTTSESAAQGVEGAWIARPGFLTFGMAVLWLTVASETSWARGVVWMHLSFGVLMVSTAVFSHKHWASGIPFDLMEDKLHSFTATAMGFAFALGVLLRLVQRWRHDRKRQTLDIIALISATFIPLLMFSHHMAAKG